MSTKPSTLTFTEKYGTYTIIEIERILDKVRAYGIGLFLSDVSEIRLVKRDFPVWKTVKLDSGEIIDLFSLGSAELCCKNSASYTEMCKEAASQDLYECPSEVGPALYSQHFANEATDFDFRYIIAMKPLSESPTDTPLIYVIKRANGDDHELAKTEFQPEFPWSDTIANFVFCRPRK
jgi:hypothetical protein